MSGVTIVRADLPEHVAAFADLCRQYAASLPESARVSLRHQGFEDELASLPGKYAPPGGTILLAISGGAWVGGVALRGLSPMEGDPAPVCEMKRLFVRPEARGLKAGRRLCERLLEDAKAMGYRMMKLDTEPDFHAAVTLYRRLGFTDIPRYNDDPVTCTLWMGKVL